MASITERRDEQQAPPPARSAVWSAVLAVAAAWRGGLRRLVRWNRSRGAGESGLARLVEVHAIQTSADAFVTLALAGSLFFSVKPDAARTRVGLYLIIAMAPFALLAPVLGPLLDRFQHGRRYALAATMVVRAVLALIIGHALTGGKLSTTEALALYPAALGVLVMQKTYAITRSAAVPRLLPEGMTLVQANSRMTIVGVFVPAIAAAVALAVVKTAGHFWALRGAALIYAIAAVFALRLPRRADGGADVREHEKQPIGGILRFGQVDAAIAGVLRSAATLRWLAGFLLFYGAFVVQEHSIGGLPKGVALAGLAVGLGAGNLIGTVIGARTAGVPAARLAVLMLTATLAATVFTALDFGVFSVFIIAVVSAATAAVSKLGLDATIQRRVEESVRTSTFARSETTMQLAWVVGGAVGILLPTRPVIGFSVAAVSLGVMLAAALGFAGRRGRVRGAADSAR